MRGDGAMLQAQRTRLSDNRKSGLGIAARGVAGLRACDVDGNGEHVFWAIGEGSRVAAEDCRMAGPGGGVLVSWGAQVRCDT